MGDAGTDKRDEEGRVTPTSHSLSSLSVSVAPTAWKPLWKSPGLELAGSLTHPSIHCF